MRRLIRPAIILLVLGLTLLMALAQARAEPRAALARPDLAHSAWVGDADGASLTLALSQPVPFRSFFLDNPPRLVIDFNEVDFAGTAPEGLPGAKTLPGMRWGAIRPGWSRLVAELDRPYRLETATETMAADGTARVALRLAAVAPEDFAPAPGAAQSALFGLPQPEPLSLPRKRQSGIAALRVVLDPGHGGIDSGAGHGEMNEARLMLSFARDLSEQLIREGVDVRLTRDDDMFLPLERRMTLAREAGADLFISLHADALAEGEASGATVYLFDPTNADRAAAQLAAHHDRADLLAGVDLGGTTDEIATVLMDLARRETDPRARRFATHLTGQFTASAIPMHKRPVQGAYFAVLKSPDIPSVLIELGFLSSAQDRARLADPAFRAGMAQAIRRAIRDWAMEDAVEAAKLRQ